MILNTYVAWIAFLVGCIAGAVPGLFFHKAEWLGGYTSWRRRLIRLGHISFFGLGALNLAFALTATAIGVETGLRLISYLLVVGVCTMPTVCYLAAYKEFFRNFFFVPALSVIAGVVLFLYRMVTR